MHSQKFAGLVLIILGAIFLLNQFSGGSISLGQWWPVFPLAAGLVSVLGGNWKGGLIVIAVFSAFLLHNLGYLNIDFSALWPVALIVIGAAILPQPPALRQCQRY